MSKQRRQFLQWAAISSAGVLLSVPLLIAVRLSIAASQAPLPQAILTLGGDPKREKAAAQLAKYHSSLDVWVSTGETPQTSTEIFRSAGIADDRVHLDYRAVDTVTNFTTLVSDLQQRQIQHIYLVTSDFHMPRAKAIATIVLGSHGITFTPVAVPSDRSPELTVRVVRDSLRSLLWLVSGRTGASVGERLNRLEP